MGESLHMEDAHIHGRMEDAALKLTTVERRDTRVRGRHCVDRGCKAEAVYPMGLLGTR